MKQTWMSLLSLLLCAALLLPTFALAQSDAESLMRNNGYVQCDDCGNWYKPDYAFTNHYCEAQPWESTDGGAALLDSGYVQCEDCGGWYMNGNEFRNHFCTHDLNNPSSNWTSVDDYYDTLVSGKLDPDTMAIGNLYVNTANGKGLNIRTRPNAQGAVQTVIPNGAAVTLFWYENSSWAFVAYRSYFGFCMTRHLTDKQPAPVKPNTTPAPAPTEDPNKMFKGFKHVDYYVAVRPTTPTGFVNMRWMPSKSAEVQCIYYADTVLRVLATNGTWSQVFNTQTNQSGFMMNAYLNKLLH